MKQFESGRSMVEVLAMLAVAGIIGSAGATQSECDKCLNTRYPRKMNGDKCVPNW